jgi:hypothetical protein
LTPEQAYHKLQTALGVYGTSDMEARTVIIKYIRDNESSLPPQIERTFITFNLEDAAKGTLLYLYEKVQDVKKNQRSVTGDAQNSKP